MLQESLGLSDLESEKTKKLPGLALESCFGLQITVRKLESPPQDDPEHIRTSSLALAVFL